MGGDVGRAKYGFAEVPEPGGAINTSASDLNDRGMLVGTYEFVDAKDEFNARGYIYDGDAYTALLPDGARNSTAVALNSSGQVIGTFTDDAGDHAYLYSDGGFQTILVAGSSQTTLADINTSGQIVGSSFDGTVATGFIYTAGATQTISDPNGTRGTTLSSINDAG